MTVKTFCIQFFPAAVQLCPINDNLSVLPPSNPRILKYPAAEQSFTQPADHILQALWFQFFQVTVDFPIWNFICCGWFPA